jgi:hypothetical protein
MAIYFSFTKYIRVTSLQALLMEHFLLSSEGDRRLQLISQACSLSSGLPVRISTGTITVGCCTALELGLRNTYGTKWDTGEDHEHSDLFHF